MVRCNLHWTGDATTTRIIKSMAVITMHPKPPHLSPMFILDLIQVLNEMIQNFILKEPREK